MNLVVPDLRRWLGHLLVLPFAWIAISTVRTNAAPAAVMPGSPIFVTTLTNAMDLDGGRVSPEQQIVVWGTFQTTWGARLNADGTIDESFHPDATAAYNPSGGQNDRVMSVAFHTDGALLVGGEFNNSISNPPRNGVFRCFHDGTRDESFVTPLTFGTRVFGVGTQPDGKVIVQGLLYLDGREERVHTIRLNSDGTLDATFPIPQITDLTVSTLFVEPDGSFYLAGQVLGVNGQSRNGFARFLSDGSLDANFVPPLALGTGWQFPSIHWLDVLPDGKVLVSGEIDTVKGETRRKIMRLHPNGDFDPGFDAGDIQGPEFFDVDYIAAEKSGKVLVVGTFNRIAGQTRLGFARLHPDGALDTGYAAQLPAGIRTIDLMSDDSAVVVGYRTVTRLASGEPPLLPPTITAQPVGLKVHEHQTAILTSSAASTEPPRFQWYRNSLPIQGATNSVLTISSARLTDLGAYYVAVANSVGVTQSEVAILEVESAFVGPGYCDPTFDPGSGPNGDIRSLQVNGSGKIVIAGTFTQFDGTNRARIARLLPNGRLDTAFDPGTGFDSPVQTVLVLPDDGLLAGGTFSRFNDRASARLCRLGPDGSLDTTFDVGDGPSGTVNGIAATPDGKFLVVGDFQKFNGESFLAIVRITGDGEIDRGFAPVPFNRAITCVSVQRDGRILVAGRFTVVGNFTRLGLARLHVDGRLDGSFNPGWGVVGNDTITALSETEDGHWLISGIAAWADEQRCDGLFKVNSHGALDAHFNASLHDVYSFARASVTSFARDSAGRIYLAGYNFPWLGHPLVCRVSRDGSFDESFAENALANEGVSGGRTSAIAVQPDGKIIVAGEFEALGGLPRHRLARLYGGPTPVTAPLLSEIVNNAVPESRTPEDRPTRPIPIREGQDLILGSEVRSAEPVQYKWELDGVAIPGATNAFLTLRNVTQSSGAIRLWTRNSAGVSYSLPVSYVLESDTPMGGRPDIRFGPAPVNGKILSLVTQPDGKVVIGGSFVTIGDTHRPLIACLNGSGALETFGPDWEAIEGSVWSVVRQSDGKFLLGGDFHAQEHASQESYAVLVRLTEAGDIDPDFQPRFQTPARVFSVSIRSDGEVAIGGQFQGVGEVSRQNIVLLKQDGSVDPGFVAATDGTVYDMIWRSDGKLLIAGAFTNVNETRRKGIALLEPDGRLDESFHLSAEPDAEIRSVSLLKDQRVVIGGSFHVLGTQQKPLVAVLSRDGAVNTSFFPSISGKTVVDTLVDRNDGILVTGDLSINRVASGIARLRSDGLRDTSFDIGSGLISPEGPGIGYCLGIGTNLQVFVGGHFSHVNGIHRRNLARLHHLTPGYPPTPAPTSAPFDRTARVGESISFSHPVGILGPATFQWRRLTPVSSNIPNATATILNLSDVGPSSAGAYALTARANDKQFIFDRVELFVIPAGARSGLVDHRSFTGGGVDGVVMDVLRLDGGGFLVGGDFLKINGKPRMALAHLNENGELDESIPLPPISAGVVRTLLRETDTTILVGGRTLDGAGRVSHLFRLLSQGIDSDFHPDFNLDAEVWSTARLSDGSIVVGGAFTMVDGQPRTNLVRFNAQGHVDPGFAPVVNGIIRSIAALEDGRVLVAGDFTQVNEKDRKLIAALLPSGALSPDFPGIGDGSGVANVATLLPADSVLVGGDFRGIPGVTNASILRLDEDGTITVVCRTFKSWQVPGEVFDLAVNVEGDVSIGGSFAGIATGALNTRPLARNGLARILKDGAINHAFDPGSGAQGIQQDPGVRTIAVEPDGNLVIGGAFSQMNEIRRSGIARVFGTSPESSLADRPPSFSLYEYYSRAFYEGKLTVINNPVADPDTPADGLSFSFVGTVPEGLQIDSTTGVVRWTPTETQGPGVYDVELRVQDSSTPPLEAHAFYTLHVLESNTPPQILEIPANAARRGDKLSVPIQIQDTDFPANPLMLWLGRNAPPGSSVDPANRLFSWEVPSDYPPGDNDIELIGFDGGPNGMTSRNFLVRVLPSDFTNSPPQLTPASGKTVQAGDLLQFTVVAHDPDVPVQTLTFEFASLPPEGAALNSRSGALQWLCNADHPIGPVEFHVRVTDSGSPPLSDEIAFSVEVRPPELRIMEATLKTPGVIQLVWASASQLRYQIQWRDELTSNEWDSSPDVIQGKEGTTSLELPLPPSQARFFRVMQLGNPD